MSKPTRDDKIAAIDIVNSWIQLEVRNGFGTDEVRHELERIYQQLERRKQTLLTPKPRKPKATATGIQIVGKTKNAKARNG